MRNFSRRRAAAAVFSLFALSLPCALFAQSAAPTDDSGGTLALGGQVILRLRSSAGSLDPAQRIAVITDRIDRVVGVPFLKPSTVIVYVPPKDKKGNHAPVIYALGRRLITVDAATAQEAGGGKPLQLAETWAKRLQQILPRIDWRPSNAPENVVPANPPLLVTSDLAKVGGDVGDVTLHDHLVIRLHGVQPDGETAAERADALTERINRAANKADLTDPNVVSVTPITPATPVGATVKIAASAKPAKPDAAPNADASDADASVKLALGSTTILTVTAADAENEKMASPTALANSWAKNIRAALDITPAAAAPAVATTTTTPAAPAAPDSTHALTATKTPAVTPAVPKTPDAP